MKVTWNELAVRFSGQTSDELLVEWRWMVPTSLEVRMVSALGDAFLESPAGEIFWLDVASAELTKISESTAEFDQLRQTPEHVEQWFMPQLIGDMLSSGLQLRAGECLSYKIPPTLGGSFEPDNMDISSLSVHFAALGKIQAQVKQMPVGTRITSVQLER
jgi:hypothetical protein